MHKAITLFTTIALGACSAGVNEFRTTPRPQPATRAPAGAPVTPAFRPPQVQTAPGVQGIVGQGASALTARFGKARIDLREGDARKLQFATRRCVLDIFLYPTTPGSQPVATHIEARLRQGGADTDRTTCIRDLDAAQ